MHLATIFRAHQERVPGELAQVELPRCVAKSITSSKEGDKDPIQ